VSLIDPETQARLNRLQSLDDAIAFRLLRLEPACSNCAREGRCVDHGSDDDLIAVYRHQHGEILSQVLTGLDPAEVDHAMRESDGTPPTVVAFSLILLARLRELAADGPYLAQNQDGPVILELENGAITEHPLGDTGETSY
jgi:hypothetical protein